MKKTTFKTRILSFGNNAGIQVPSENIAELGTSKKPPVIVTIADYSYKSTVAVMGGKYMISFPKAHREASGLSAGDSVVVTLELEEGERSVEIPVELHAALNSAGITENFNKLAYSKRKEFCRQVADAKTEETKIRRIQKIIDSFKL